MNLLLVRYCYGPDHVAGLLKFGTEQQHSLWTLECAWQNNQAFISCIPDGSYSVVAFESPEHPDCWVITPVDNRNGILIHTGNEVAHTQGCVLIGQTQKPGWVGNSRDALRQLNFFLSRNEQHTITIGPGMGAQLEPQRDDNQSDSGDGPAGGGLAAVPDGGQPDIL